MKFDKINKMFGNIKADRMLKENQDNFFQDKFISNEVVESTNNNSRKKRFRIIIIGAVTAVIVTIVSLVIVNPFDILFNTRDKQISTMVEIADKTFALNNGGILFKIDQDGNFQKYDLFSADRIYSDGKAIYFSYQNKVYRYDPETMVKSVLWEDKVNDKIYLDYIDKNLFIYHLGNHNNYTMVNRVTAKSNTMINRDDEAFFTLLDTNGKYAVFSYDYWNYNDKPYIDIEALYLLDMESNNFEKIYSNLVYEACITSNNTLYFMPFDIKKANGEIWSSKIYSMDLSLKTLKEIDLSKIDYTKLQSFTCINGYLYIAVDNTGWPVETEITIKTTDDVGILYRYDIETSEVDEISKIGYVFNIVKSPSYIYFYSLYNEKKGQSILLTP